MGIKFRLLLWNKWYHKIYITCIRKKSHWAECVSVNLYALSTRRVKNYTSSFLQRQENHNARRSARTSPSLRSHSAGSSQQKYLALKHSPFPLRRGKLARALHPVDTTARCQDAARCQEAARCQDAARRPRRGGSTRSTATQPTPAPARAALAATSPEPRGVTHRAATFPLRTTALFLLRYV